MNKRKTLLSLLGGLLAALAIGAFLFPFIKGAAAVEEDAKNDLIHPPAKNSPPANFDALADFPARSTKLQNNPQLENGHLVQTEPRFDVPTFLWTNDQGKAQTLSGDSLQRSVDEIAAARAHLGNFASRYRLDRSAVAEAQSVAVHDTGSGAIIVKFKQTIGGVEVFRDELNVIMNRKLQLVALSGYLTGDNTENALQNFNLQPTDALAGAIRDLTGTSVDTALLQPVQSLYKETNPYQRFTAENNLLGTVILAQEPSRVKQVMFHLPDGYVPAYYVETSIMVPSDEVTSIFDMPVLKELGYSYVISAVDGRILFRKNLSADQKQSSKRSIQKQTRANVIPNVAYTYRVWADPVTLQPYDTPAGNGVHPKIDATPDGVQYPFVAQQDVTLQNYPFSNNDPWLPAGAVDTNGNNADAFVDLTTPDGYSPVAAAPYDGTSSTGDFRALPTGSNAFQHSAVADTNPATAEARQSGIQQLFYNINFLHDFYYDAGFNEAAGNAQTDNYARGGLAADNIKAQAQDFAARNNANMLTPADGSRPRMRMYVFDTQAPKYVDVLSPAAAAGKRSVGTGQFGAQVFDLTNQVVQPNPASGCTAASYTGTAGKIVMVDREPTATCSIGTKLNNAMAAGVSAFILVNLSTTPDTLVNVTGSLPTFTIPFLTITWNGAASIKTQLAASQTVNARMVRSAGIDRDGTIDNQIVFHEWGHYISNRLIGNAAGLNTNLSGGLGEGWGDFTAMMLTVRPDDTSTPSNANWNGAYALATYATSGGPSGDINQGYYWGIRRVPYSTDMTKNGLTYKHIANGNALPPAVPTGFGLDGSNNAEVHNTGEVWATMLWECYAALLRDTQGATPRLTFLQAQTRMKNYLVAAYKMTPVSPTLLEARDAVLAAAFAGDPVDGQLFAQAFAKRGAGTNAVSPNRFSGDNSGVVESFTVTGQLAFEGAALDDSMSAELDGYLDAREKGLLKVTVNNVGLAALSNTTVSVSSTDPLIGFPNGNTVNVPTIQPFVPQTVSIVVEAGNMFHNLRTTNFNITIDDPANTLVAPITPTYWVYTNADELPGTWATDTVEAKSSPWTISSSSNTSLSQAASSKWRRQAVGTLNYVWFAPDISAPSDQYLTSPVMTVNGGGSVNLQFDHSFGFEFDGGGNYDGGVVEMSVNGGAFADIGSSAYNGTILSGTLNPLAGRTGFVQNSAGTIHTSLTQAVAPGSTVSFRFRLGSDNVVGAAGWQVDNIAVNGVVETPFTTLVGELTPTAASVSVEGRVFAGGRSLARAVVSYMDETGTLHTATTNTFGYYRFAGVQAGSTYVFSVRSKGFNFAPQLVTVDDAVDNLDFTAQE